MAQKINLVEDNTSPPITLTLERDGSAIDLTSASTVKLIIKQNGGSITNALNQTCVISTPLTSGIVVYSPIATDFPSTGNYTCEVKITYNDATYEILYEQLKVHVRSKLG